MSSFFKIIQETIQDFLNFNFLEGFQNQTASLEVIPKKIFQTWHSSDLPPKMRENSTKLKINHPDFEYYLFDDESCRKFIEMNFDSGVVGAFDQLVPGAYKADLWRYCVLYTHGGIYLDIKFHTMPSINLRQFLDKEYFVRDLPNYDVVGVYNGFMVCKPQNPILMKCIKQIVYNVQNRFYGYTCLDPTGPHLLMKYFTEEQIQQMELSLDVKVIGTHNIMYNNNVWILSTYSEYRNEQAKNQKKEYYVNLWFDKLIYQFSPMTRIPLYNNFNIGNIVNNTAPFTEPASPIEF
jgi:mannosyltransferase OCH1-like enzyme